ncbi:MAG: septum site-determining protein MinD, partial [Microcystis panniformis]
PLVLEEKTSLPSMAFRNIAQRLQGRDVPFLDLMAGQEGFLTRLRRRVFGP